MEVIVVQKNPHAPGNGVMAFSSPNYVNEMPDPY